MEAERCARNKTLSESLALWVRKFGASRIKARGSMEDFIRRARFFQHRSLNAPWHDDPVMQLIAIGDRGPFTTLAFAQPDASWAGPWRSPATS